jgi:ribose transport system ATP-binding protein
VVKSFGATKALKGVRLQIDGGEVHALIGGNGCGKSTLIKILAGVQQANPGGVIRVGDVEVHADHVTPAFAHEAGVRVVHQDLGVFPDLTVAENMAFGVEGFPTGFGGRIRRSELRRRSVELIERFGIRARPETLLRDLNRATQTEVAIARALQGQDAAAHAGLLILDEPTTALPAAEVDALLATLRRLAGLGQSILFVSHRLDEVLRVTDRVTILRDGRKAGTWTTADLDEDGLVTAILGRALEPAAAITRTGGSGAPVLELRGLRAGPLRSADLLLARGEVVGARAEIYRAIREAAASGMAVLVVTSDVEELAHLADRAVILRRGRVVAEIHGADLQAHRLTTLIHQGEASRVDAA